MPGALGHHRRADPRAGDPDRLGSPQVCLRQRDKVRCAIRRHLDQLPVQQDQEGGTSPGGNSWKAPGFRGEGEGNIVGFLLLSA